MSSALAPRSRSPTCKGPHVTGPSSCCPQRRTEEQLQNRCPWASDELLAAYHDAEWGVPIRDDRHLFELLTLEGAQAGLSWRTVLAKRPAYRAAFSGFDPVQVAAFTAEDVARLMSDAGIIRNRQKITSTITNAAVVLDLAERHGSFSNYLWSHVNDRPIVHAFDSLEEIPAADELSKVISSELRGFGMRFVGPTIVYSYLQSAGLVLDHLVSCPRWKALCS